MDEHITTTQESARQGNKGRPVLYVLVASLVLLGIYMIGLMTWASRESSDTAGQESSRAQVTGSTTPSSSNTSGVPAANPAYPVPATRDAGPPAPKP